LFPIIWKDSRAIFQFLSFETMRLEQGPTYKAAIRLAFANRAKYPDALKLILGRSSYIDYSAYSM